MNNVLCPHCGKQVELSEAFTHQMRETVRVEHAAKHKAELEKAQLAVEKQASEHKAALEKATLEAEEKALKKAKETLELQLRNTQNEAEETSKRNRELQEQILALTKEMRSLTQKDKERELEMQKKFLKEREQIEMEVTKSVKEDSRLKEMELQKQLDDTKKALEDAQRKAAQTSQQLQGEVLELDLENQLAEYFATDEINPVPKGFEGADLQQVVKNKFGNKAGIILWETKRTKAWGGDWTIKLKDDKRRIDASCGIIVSDVLPNGITTFGFYEGVWVTCFKYALPLANVLRNGLMEVAIARATAAHKDERLEALFNYLTKDGFRNKFEAQVESLVALKNDLDAEQRSTVRMWKKREMQLNRLMGNTAAMYGELQGILGSSLPSLPSLESPTLMSGDDEQKSLLD
ncbi:MAG: DUF2130 domain-containing protein [Candidatus Levybacteria bacterium]|nr:DUF2130 domain-containing protein [Candidatus Levybacteria bacterium]